jgi:predicted lipoprotein with Yx(FWY)xxD motif
MLPFLLAGVLAACGDDDNGSSGSAATTTTAGSKSTTTAGGSSAAVVKFTSSAFGDILTDTDGKTLYVFMKDTGTTSACETGCIEAWPPLTVTGTPSGDGVEADDLGTTTRTDGTTQVTFYGHPVYYYAADSAPGDTNGQGVGGIWFVVDKDGNAVKDAAGSGGATSTTKAASASSDGY